jgi:hypothetical protein
MMTAFTTKFIKLIEKHVNFWKQHKISMIMWHVQALDFVIKFFLFFLKGHYQFIELVLTIKKSYVKLSHLFGM